MFRNIFLTTALIFSVASFADGHSEIKKWQSQTTTIPVKYGWGMPTFDAKGKLDYQWWKDRTGFIKY